MNFQNQTKQNNYNILDSCNLGAPTDQNICPSYTGVYAKVVLIGSNSTSIQVEMFTLHCIRSQSDQNLQRDSLGFQYDRLYKT